MANQFVDEQASLAGRAERPIASKDDDRVEVLATGSLKNVVDHLAVLRGAPHTLFDELGDHQPSASLDVPLHRQPLRVDPLVVTRHTQPDRHFSTRHRCGSLSAPALPRALGARTGHMVVIEPGPGGFLVRDPLPGVNSERTTAHTRAR